MVVHVPHGSTFIYLFYNTQQHINTTCLHLSTRVDNLSTG